MINAYSEVRNFTILEKSGLFKQSIKQNNKKRA